MDPPASIVIEQVVITIRSVYTDCELWIVHVCGCVVVGASEIEPIKNRPPSSGGG